MENGTQLNLEEIDNFLFGVDPGFTHFGIVVYGVRTKKIYYVDTIRTKPESKKRNIYVSDDESRRVLEIGDWYTALIRKWKPERIFTEAPSGGALSANSAKGLSYARAISLLPPRILGVPIVWVTPEDAKKAATGNPNASKQAVEEAVRKRFDFKQWSIVKGNAEHQFDAAAVLLHGLGMPMFMYEK